MNMEHDLIERYIYAVTRQLPSKVRAEVEMELDGLIAEMLEERCGPILPTEKDIRVVLTELGTPTELAAKYSGEEHKALISGNYFLIYKRVLKIVLPIVAVVMLFVVPLSILLDRPDNIYVMVLALIFQTLGSMLAAVFQAFAIITFIFAILERTKERIDLGDAFANLPQVPQKSEQIKPFEPIVGMVFSLLAVALFLGFPQICGVYLEDSGWLPILSVEVLRSLWLPIILWAVLSIIKESVRLVEGQYTIRLAIVTTVVNILVLVCSAVVFLNNAIVNPDFLRYMTGLITTDVSQLVPTVIVNFNLVLLGLICFALILDIVVVFAKALRSRNKTRV
jgi:hypothetical protein